MLDIEIHLQVWKELKPHLIGGDVDAAAEDFIHVLIEHGADANDIAEFAVDSAIKAALQEYTELEAEEEFEDEDETDYGFEN